jgi:hypothetical protein
MKKNVALVLIGMVLGVGAGALATGRVRAQGAPAPAARWEQDCAEARGVEEIRALVRARGEAGWELAAFDAGILCFKRPMPPPTASPAPRPAPAPKPQEPWPGY